MSARDIISLFQSIREEFGSTTTPRSKISNINYATITNDFIDISADIGTECRREGDKIVTSIWRLYRTLYGKVRANRTAIISFVVVVRELFISTRLGLQTRWMLSEGMRSKKRNILMELGVAQRGNFLQRVPRQERELTRLGINFWRLAKDKTKERFLRMAKDERWGQRVRTSKRKARN